MIALTLVVVLLAVSVIGLYLALWRMSAIVKAQRMRINEMANASIAQAQLKLCEDGRRLIVNNRLNEHEARLDGLARVADLGGFESKVLAQRLS